jgi:predicted ATPase/DNA-binding SARP family transcriptional activator
MTDAARARVRVFGGLRIDVPEGTDRGAAEASVRLGGRQERAVLAILITEIGRAVSGDGFIDALWPGDPPPTAAKTVQVYVNRLRRALGPAAIQHGPAGYRLDPQAIWLDFDAFEASVGRGRGRLAAGDAAGALAAFDDALDVASGEAFADLRDVDVLGPSIERIEERRWEAVEGRFDAALAMGGAADLVTDLRSAVAARPLREHLRAQLMVALYRSGRQAEALEEYHRLRATLADDLGVDPSPELAHLEMRILQQDAGLLAPVDRSTNLPTIVDELLGRDRELGDLIGFVEGARIVTITGPGGIGKTRLAIALAHAMVARFPDGAAFVDCSTIVDPGQIVPTVMRELGLSVPSTGHPTEDLAAVLSGRRILLILDNFEHLAPWAKIVSGFLSRALHARAIVTSRVTLRLREELTYPLKPLEVRSSPTGPDTSPATALFLRRARMANANRQLGAADVAAAGELCRRVDGIPLAIELLAARTRSLPPATLAGEVDRTLPLLLDGPIDAPNRQQTMTNAIEWSVGALRAEERTTFSGLCVFAGGFGRDQATVVCELPDPRATSDRIERLLDASLVETTPAASGDPRWRILAPLREFGSGLLSDTAADGYRERHAQGYERLVAELIDPDAGCRGAGAFLRLSEEQANLAAAYGTLVDRDPDRALRLAIDLEDFWNLSQQQAEGRRWVEPLLDRIADPGLRCRALAAVLRLDKPLGDVAHGRATLDRLEAAGCTEPYVIARKLVDGAWLVTASGIDRETRLREGLAIAEPLGALGVVARANILMPNATRADLERTLAVVRERDFIGAEIGLLNTMGIVEAEAGRWPESLTVTRQADELGQRLGFPNLVVSNNVGNAQMESGDYAGAEATFKRTIAGAFRAGNEPDVGYFLQTLADLACRAGQGEIGATLWAAGQRLILAGGVDQAAEDAAAAETVSLQAARAAIGEEIFDRAWAAGLELEVRDAVDLALETRLNEPS